MYTCKYRCSLCSTLLWSLQSAVQIWSCCLELTVQFRVIARIRIVRNRQVVFTQSCTVTLLRAQKVVKSGCTVFWWFVSTGDTEVPNTQCIMLPISAMLPTAIFKLLIQMYREWFDFFGWNLEALKTVKRLRAKVAKIVNENKTMTSWPPIWWATSLHKRAAHTIPKF